MGTITGQEIVNRARRVLQDTATGGTRWLDAEMLDWINEGQRMIVLLKPNAKSTTATVTMVAGAKQSIPTGGIQLLSISRNMGTFTSIINRVDRRMMDGQDRDWYNATANNKAKHYVFDEDAPDVFYLYPPQTATPGDIEMTYSVAPTDLVSLAGTIDLNDIYDTALLDYLLYRCYSKDTDYAGNQQRSAAHFQAFSMSVAGKQTSEAGASPNYDQPMNRGI